MGLCVLALSAPVPPSWHAPEWWLGTPSQGGHPATGAWCIHEHEGAWNSIGYVHGVATYGGGYQFTLWTWRSVQGRGSTLSAIARSSPREQTYRAFLVWKRDGGSWREWGTRKVCGLT